MDCATWITHSRHVTHDFISSSTVFALLSFQLLHLVSEMGAADRIAERCSKLLPVPRAALKRPSDAWEHTLTAISIMSSSPSVTKSTLSVRKCYSAFKIASSSSLADTSAPLAHAPIGGAIPYHAGDWQGCLSRSMGPYRLGLPPDAHKCRRRHTCT